MQRFKNKKMIAPQWTRLDNAAIIYPSCRTRHYAAQFRVSVDLDHEVCEQTLDQALKNIINRFPSFSYTLGKGFFWWYLHHLENLPCAGKSDTMNIFSLKDNGGFMFKAGCRGNQITLDVFHALTDGTGAMTFLLSLTAEYLRLQKGIKPEYGKWILNPAEEASPAEMEDSFDSFSGGKGHLDKEKAAWHIPGRKESYDVLHDTRISMSAEQLKEKAREYDCTVTELLTALMLGAMQDTRRQLCSRHANSNLKIEVPVNLRPLFNSRTMRNFSSYVHIGVDVKHGDYSFDELVNLVRKQKKDFVRIDALSTRVNANVALEDNMAIRCLPRFIKKPCINLVNRIKGDRYCTHTLSNIGNITLPESVAAHVRDIDFILGRSLGKSGSAACVSFGGRLNLNMSRRIADTDFERNFLRQLDNIGIDTNVLFDTVAERKSILWAPVKHQMRLARIGWTGTPLVI